MDAAEIREELKEIECELDDVVWRLQQVGGEMKGKEREAVMAAMVDIAAAADGLAGCLQSVGEDEE